MYMNPPDSECLLNFVLFAQFINILEATLLLFLHSFHGTWNGGRSMFSNFVNKSLITIKTTSIEFKLSKINSNVED